MDRAKRLKRIKRRIHMRKVKRFVRNGFLTLSVIMASVVFVGTSFQFTLGNPWGTLGLILSGGYILVFCWVNGDE